MPVRERPRSEFDQTQSETGPRTVTLDALIGGYQGYTSPDLLSPKFWRQSSNVYAGQFGTIRRARWAPFLNSTTAGFVADGFRILSMFSWSEPIYNYNWIFFDNNDPAAPITDGFNMAPGRWVIRNPPSAIILTSLASGVQFYFSQLGDDPLEPNGPGVLQWPLATSLLNGPYMRTSISNLILEANNLLRSKVRIIQSPAFYGGATIFPIGEYWGIDAPDVSPQVALASGSTATIAASPTGAVRSNNIVTITTTAAHGLSPGVYITISGVTDTTFNSAAGTAYLLLTASGTTMTFAQVGANATSGSGTVTYGITKTVGRSYAYAWENANTGHVSAPSPVSQFVKYTNQIGTISCYELGTITTTALSTTVTGVGTSFSQAWVGKALVTLNNSSTSSANIQIIVSVQSPTQLTISRNPTFVGGGQSFQVVDTQATHIRLYATGDGAAVYFLIARNGIGSLATLQFTDTAQSEPPNPPFSSEISQIYNIPPPIGQFVDQYQSRAIVYGVTGAPQTFFYSNIENTVVGVPPESFSPLNTVTLPIGDGKLFGTANLPTGFIIWSNRQDMFKMTGLLSDNSVANATQLGATIQRLPYKIGCASPYAVAVTPMGAMWLSSDREVWLFTDNYAPKNIGKPVQDVLNRINGSRLAFAKISYFKRGERSWLALAVALDSSTFNSKLLLLDLDLLSSNGQPSFFTFDMATNAPTWYQYDINCEGVCTSYDNNSVNHLLVGDIDLITDADWQTGYYTIGAEQNVLTGNVIVHAFGNEDAHMIKTVDWMRVLTNQVPKYLASQNWQWDIYAYDDDQFIIGVSPDTPQNVTHLVPGVNSNSNPLFLEYSPAKFKFGATRPVKGRRFQIGTTFPSGPGLYELRGFQVSYTNLVGR
jgi:hypothetical protein